MPNRYPRKNWRRILLSAMTMALAVSLIAAATVFAVDVASLFQPSAPLGTYVYPHVIRGRLHYLTRVQTGLLSVAEWAFWSGLGSFFAAAIANEWRKFRADKSLRTRRAGEP